jgi:hypothetical protein
MTFLDRAIDDRHGLAACVATGLGWTSLLLGAGELLYARPMARLLGVERQAWLVRLFGMREIGTGLAVLASDRRAVPVWSRVGGDALDLLALALAWRNAGSRQSNVAAAAGIVAAIAAVLGRSEESGG